MAVHKIKAFSSIEQRIHRQVRSLKKEKAVSRTISVLSNSELFDTAWYCVHYPDVAQHGFNPVVHYVSHGAAEGRWPHPLFHTDWYVREYPDVAETGINPLLHFLLHGAAEDRDPNPFFRTSWYRATYLQDASSAGDNPVLAFLRKKTGDTNPSPDFDSGWYREHYLADNPGEMNPLVHYIIHARGPKRFPHARAEEEHRRQTQLIRDSGLFDPEFYRSHYPDVRDISDPLEHYMFYGAGEGRAPHILFDVGWYRAQTGAIPEALENPLAHFLQSGAYNGYNPNAWFDSRWYLDFYPDCRTAGQNPLAHFLRHGGWRTSPSVRFDAVWYYRRYPDVSAVPVNPLVHYLSSGLAEGRSTRPIRGSRQLSDIPTNAAMTCLKSEKRGDEVALFITHSPNGSIKAHVEHYVRSLASEGVDVILVVAADQRKTSVPQTLIDSCSGVFVRENTGFDFAAWAHILAVHKALYGASILYLTNDSLVGPIKQSDFRKLFARVRDIDADIVGLTENVYYARHLQSFFLAIKRKALSSYALHRFFQDISNLGDKDAVILQYEITFSARMRAAGLSCQALFKAGGEGPNGFNRTILDWQQLAAEGFPFMKASLLTGEHRGKGGAEVEAFMHRAGYDTTLIDFKGTHAGEKTWADLRRPRYDRAGPHVSFIGPYNYANGLGAASRGYVAALFRTNMSVNISPVQRPFHVHARTAPAWRAKSYAGPADVALVHLNGDGWDVLLTPEQTYVAATAKLRIGMFVWELSIVPDAWLPVINGLDAIWAPSEFCANIFRNWTNVPVHVIPYVVPVPLRAPVSAAVLSGVRRALNLDPRKRVILYAFDGSSFLARKNPHALVRAFRASGLERKGWQLVLKTKHVFDIPTEGESLMKLIGGSSGIRIVDQPLSRTELNRLFAVADVYASSHSSEGFGLTIAEAMAMGKVVVATDYAGSRDFLDASCGFPVRADLTTLEKDLGPYAKGGMWAVVDEAALARALQEAALAVLSGSDIGSKARERIGRQLSIEAVANAMEDSICTLVSAKTRPVS